MAEKRQRELLVQYTLTTIQKYNRQAAVTIRYKTNTINIGTFYHKYPVKALIFSEKQYI